MRSTHRGDTPGGSARRSDPGAGSRRARPPGPGAGRALARGRRVPGRHADALATSGGDSSTRQGDGKTVQPISALDRAAQREWMPSLRPATASIELVFHDGDSDRSSSRCLRGGAASMSPHVDGVQFRSYGPGVPPHTFRGKRPVPHPLAAGAFATLAATLIAVPTSRDHIRIREPAISAPDDEGTSRSPHRGRNTGVPLSDTSDQ